MDELFYSDLQYEFDQLALFGEVTYSLTDRLDLTGGLRWYDFDEDRTQTFDGLFADPGTTSGTVTADGVAPRVMASYRVSDATHLNAQVSKGFRLGGINDPLNVPLCTDEDLERFTGFPFWEDEELWNYEIGSKSTIMGGKGRLNAALFYMDISELQATITAGSCSSRLILNVPQASSTGLELEWAAQVSDHLDFAVSTSYVNSELDSTLTQPGPGGVPIVLGGIEKGNRLPTVPEFQFAAAANYQWLMQNDWLGYVTGTYKHIGSRYTQIGDQAEGFGTVNLLSFEPNTIGGPLTASTFTFNPELPSYDLFNLRVGISNVKWDIALFINNITDETAFLALDQERGTRARVGYLTNQPREFGISTRVNF
jgi:iron complex outermembrane receptor protein